MKQNVTRVFVFHIGIYYTRQYSYTVLFKAKLFLSEDAIFMTDSSCSPWFTTNPAYISGSSVTCCVFWPAPLGCPPPGWGGAGWGGAGSAEGYSVVQLCPAAPARSPGQNNVNRAAHTAIRSCRPIAITAGEPVSQNPLKEPRRGYTPTERRGHSPETHCQFY